ncbi:MAG: hypothetical protein AAGI50_00395 [Pseudomonadota bacterium]
MRRIAFFAVADFLALGADCAARLASDALRDWTEVMRDRRDVTALEGRLAAAAYALV